MLPFSYFSESLLVIKNALYKQELEKQACPF
jgi:hypothetical protein